MTVVLITSNGIWTSPTGEMILTDPYNDPSWQQQSHGNWTFPIIMMGFIHSSSYDRDYRTTTLVSRTPAALQPRTA